MDSRPAVSCICLTHGRPALLEEAIHSFLQQDYCGTKELIVLNDDGGQVLELEHPEVRVINLPERVRTIGEKWNMAVGLASHDLLFVWDDGDISLPHRLTFSVSKLRREQGYFKPDQAWLWNSGRLRGPVTSSFHAGSCWTREYTAPGSTGTYAIRPDDIFHLHRWFSAKSGLVSGFGEDEAGHIPRGHIHLGPHWKQDYPRLVAETLQELAKSQKGQRHGAEGDGRLAPKISVILLGHDDPAALDQAIESIRTQDFTSWEMIIVADGATALARAVIERHVANDDRIRAAGEVPVGMVAARARGFELARGDYVYCLDTRNRSLETALRRLHEHLLAAPEAVVAYGVPAAPVHRDDQRSQEQLTSPETTTPLDVLSRLAGDEFFNAGAVAFRRDALFDEAVGEAQPLEDSALWWRLATAGSVAFVGDEPLSEAGPSARFEAAASSRAHLRASGEKATMGLSAQELASDTVFLAGMGRSGTTWAADIVNYDGGFRVMFEPFLPVRVHEADAFEYIQYVNPLERDPVLVGAAQTILAGRVHNSWVDQESSGRLATRRIIKDIRCNLMLRWLKELCPAMPIVLLMRHPLAVAESWLKLGWGADPSGKRTVFDIITSQPTLLDDFPIIGEVKDKIDTDSLLERVVFQWCVFHVVPFKQFEPDDLFLLTYEDLLLHPKEQIERLFGHLNIPMSWDKVASRLQTPSSANILNRDFAKDQMKLLTGWKSTFSDQQVKRAHELLAMFGLDDLYDEDGHSRGSHGSHVR